MAPLVAAGKHAPSPKPRKRRDPARPQVPVTNACAALAIDQMPSESALSLCRLAQELIEEAFRPIDPMKVHETITAEECAQILGLLKPKFIHHPLSKKYIQGILSEMGCDLSQTYFDVPRMRTAFPGDYLKSGIAYAFHPHRDTW